MGSIKDPAMDGNQIVSGEVLDHITDAVVLLDGRTLVLRANRSAADILACSKALCIGRDGRLLVADRAAQEYLEARLSHFENEKEHSLGPERIVVVRPKARPLLLLLRPLQHRVPHGPIATLKIADPDSPTDNDGAGLRAAYGLSPAETRIVQAITKGLSLKQVARRDGLSYETVRSYVKRVLVKTGAHRQADLVRLAGTLR